MRYIFFGTPEFAEVVLRQVLEANMPPAAVVCNPDRPVGRKKIITPPPVKVLAEKHSISVLQPEKLTTDFIEELKGLSPEFAVVAAYAKIIPQSVIDIFSKGVIGVHPSLLPKYRGASPIQSVLLNGEKETGITLYLLDEKMDNGPILTSEQYTIKDDEMYESLEKNLAEIGGKLLTKIVPDYLSNKLTPHEQVHSEATFTKKFSTQDGFVDPKELEEARSGEHQEKAIEIHNKIRAFSREPGVWTAQDDKRMKISQSSLKNNALVLEVIQYEGKTPQSI